MSEAISVVQFLPPWRSLSGVRRFSFHPDKPLERMKDVKPGKALRKATKNIDGLLLRPSWPTRKGLVLASLDDKTLLFELTGSIVTPGTQAIDINSPGFRMQIDERGLYRKFTFCEGDEAFVFHDFAGRLVGPQRQASRVFPEDDFSPFARLIGILRDDTMRSKLLSDFVRHRFKYSRWVEQTNQSSSDKTGFSLQD